MTSAAQRLKTFLLIAAAIVLISLFKSTPQLNYQTWAADEQYVVVKALGFLDFDLNPHWFKYHTLPMYVTSAMYFSGYAVAGGDKVEFVSRLYANDAPFYISARILFSIVFVTATFLLGWILYRRSGSAAAALVFIALSNLSPDAFDAANRVRTDTFYFLFSCGLLYFAGFAERNLRNIVLATICAAAAFCSKFTALPLILVLAGHLGWLALRKELPRFGLLAAGLTLPLALFLCMPYALLDWPEYQEALKAFVSVSGEHFYSYGYEESKSAFGRLTRPWLTLGIMAGWPALLLFVAQGLRAVVKERELIAPFCYAGATIAVFSTSPLVQPYWLRPPSVFVLFFAILLLVRIARHERCRLKLPILLALFAGITLAFQFPQTRTRVASYLESGTDTRFTAAEWIAQHIPEGSVVVLDGHHRHYLPKVFSGDIRRDVNLYHNYHINRNYLLEKAFAHFLETTRPVHHDVRLIDPSMHATSWSLDGISIPPGAYVITAGPIRDRFSRPGTMERIPKLSARARAFYAFIDEQESIAHFTGRGPEIRIARMREGLSVFKERNP